MTEGDQRVIQVSNVASTIVPEQLQLLFAHVGTVEECRLYPTTDQALENGTRIGFVKFQDPWSVGVAMHLTDVQFMERPLLIYPMESNDLPDEEFAIKQLAPCAPISANNVEEKGESDIPVKLTNEISVNAAGAKVINTIDPSLALKGAPNYPALPMGLTDENIEEIRRTIYVGNLDPNLTNELILKFFSQCGEIKYVRMGGEPGAAMKHCFVEFTEQTSVGNAFQFNGTLLGSRAMVVSHSSTAIIKPRANDKGDGSTVGASPGKARSRSMSRPRLLPRSNSRMTRGPRRSRSRSRPKRRSRSRDRRRSRERKRSRSRERRRSRDRYRKRSKDRRDDRRKSPSTKPGPKTPEGMGPATPPGDSADASRSVDRRSVERTSKHDESSNGKTARRDRDDDRDKASSRSKRRSRSRSREKKRRSRSKDRRRRSVSPRKSVSRRRTRSRDGRRRRTRSRSKSVDRRRRSKSAEKRKRRSESGSRDRKRSRSKERRDRRRSPEKKPHPPPARDYDEEERTLGDPLNPALVAASIIAPLAPMGPALPPPPPTQDAEDMDLSD